MEIYLYWKINVLSVISPKLIYKYLNRFESESEMQLE